MALPKLARTASHTVGAVDSAMRIMRYLGQTNDPARLVAISRDLGLNPSTCLNVLRTLADDGFVEHQPVLKTYALGPAVLDLARHFLIDIEEYQQVQPLLDEYSGRHRASVALWRRIDNRDLVTVAHSGVGALMHLRAIIGTRVPILTGSMGRALASVEQPDQEWLRTRFEEATWKSSNDFQAFLDGARRARDRGWAVDQGNYGGVAVAISRAARVEFIVSIMFFENQLSDAQIEIVGSALAELATKIADHLKLTPPGLPHRPAVNSQE